MFLVIAYSKVFQGEVMDQFIKQLAIGSGKIIREGFGNISNIEVKKNAGLVTDVDKKSEDFKTQIKHTMDEKKEVELNRLLRLNQKEISELKQKILTMQGPKDKAGADERVLKTKYDEINIKKQKLESEISSFTQNLRTHNNAFQAILKSFVKALTLRKRLVIE